MIKNEVLKNEYSKTTIVVDQYEFEDIAAEFINCEEYMKLADEKHHGGERLKHSFKVAKATYQIAKSLGLDYKSATRAAFLHDFFFDKNFEENLSGLDKAKMHPKEALINSQKYFNINEKEADAILNHMYPLTPKRPESMEGITLSVVDKGVAVTDKISAIWENAKARKVLVKKSKILVWILFLYNSVY